MAIAKTKKEQLLELAGKTGVIRPKDLEGRGIAKIYLKRLVAEGLLENPQRGLYMLAGKDFGEYHTLIEASKKIPQGVVCLLSALKFHELGTQSPSEVWLALPNKAWSPKVESLPLRIVRYSEKSCEAGVEVHVIHGVSIKIYNIPKTVADCFKYRNKIGLDVAIEALKECWRTKKCSINDLWKYAKICRVSKVMKPYLEMLV